VPTLMTQDLRFLRKSVLIRRSSTAMDFTDKILNLMTYFLEGHKIEWRWEPLVSPKKP